jgi:zinc/manganese transport system substrate-binding protein
MRPPIPTLAVLGLLALGGGACGTETGSGPAASAPSVTVAGEPCPVAPIPVVVSVDQWGDIVKQLGGRCTEVTTIIENSSVDPHDYEPTVADIAKFSGAELVVVNGADYDPWADNAAKAVSPSPAVVNGGEVVGVKQGDNPHLWYSPDFVTQISTAITAELSTLQPTAAPYFTARAADWDKALEPYRAEIASIKSSSASKPFGSTESVFDYMAAAVGLENLTPQGYQNAAANSSDPAPGDVAELQQLLRDKKIIVLVVNTQTSGSIPEQIEGVATDSGVPVVGVSETVPPGVDSFVQWQVSQLQALRKALA